MQQLLVIIHYAFYYRQPRRASAVTIFQQRVLCLIY